jgi:uncharacterized surface protein with fasciclin (FAS1) repeats
LQTHEKLSVHVLLVALLLSVATVRCGSGPSLLKSGSSLLSSLGGVPSLSQFTSLLKTPGLDKLLGGVLKKPFTMLAPTNDALSSAGSALSSLTSDPSKLANVLKNYIIPGKHDASALAQSGLKAASGKALDLGGATLGNMISGDNYNVFPIDKVLGGN